MYIQSTLDMSTQNFFFEMVKTQFGLIDGYLAKIELFWWDMYLCKDFDLKKALQDIRWTKYYLK